MFSLHGVQGVKAGEMFADNLIGGISLDSFRPSVPTGDLAFTIQQKDCIVGNRLDGQAKPLFTLNEGIFYTLTFRDVPKYKHRTVQPSRAIFHRPGGAREPALFVQAGMARE